MKRSILFKIYDSLAKLVWLIKNDYLERIENRLNDKASKYDKP